VINWQGTVISQYNQSPTIQTLLYAVNQWLDPTVNLNDFYRLVWNVDTAEGYGLDVWGRIVAVDRVLHIQVDDPWFGFEEATALSAWPFNQGIFFNNEPLTGNFALSDDGYRVLILAKAAFNIIDGSIPAINQLLINLFGSMGKTYITDNRDMSLSYVFEFIPPRVVAAIISQSGVLPKPTGVAINYSFGQPSWLRRGVSAQMGGAGQVRAAPTVSLAPSLIAGAGLITARPTSRGVSAAVLGGAGSLAASTTTILARQAPGASLAAGQGGLHADAIIHRGVGAAGLIGGAGGLGAAGAAHVRAIDGAIITGAGGVLAQGRRMIPAAARIAGLAALRATGSVI
jgi:hypothetical protein